MSTKKRPKKAAKKVAKPQRRKLIDIRDPNVTWYGPHPCPACSRTIITTARDGPELTLDASDHDHHYPNFLWKEHVCRS